MPAAFGAVRHLRTFMREPKAGRWRVFGSPGAGFRQASTSGRRTNERKRLRSPSAARRLTAAGVGDRAGDGCGWDGLWGARPASGRRRLPGIAPRWLRCLEVDGVPGLGDRAGDGCWGGGLGGGATGVGPTPATGDCSAVAPLPGGRRRAGVGGSRRGWLLGGRAWGGRDRRRADAGYRGLLRGGSVAWRSTAAGVGGSRRGWLLGGAGFGGRDRRRADAGYRGLLCGGSVARRWTAAGGGGSRRGWLWVGRALGGATGVGPTPATVDALRWLRCPEVDGCQADAGGRSVPWLARLSD